MEKGYMHASLRNICKNAGVTTGALYFFFKDKEDLFAALVEEPLHKLFVLMNSHYLEEVDEVKTGIKSIDDYSSDLEAAKQVIYFMYEYKDAFLLLLTKSQGSRFEYTLDQFAEITSKHYRTVADYMSKNANAKPVDDFLVHWLAHTHMELFTHLITQDISKEKAVEYIEAVLKYVISGWNGLFR